MYVGETGNEPRYQKTENRRQQHMTDKNLQEAINEAFEQSRHQTATLKLNTLRHLDELRKEQLRRARCEE